MSGRRRRSPFVPVADGCWEGMASESFVRRRGGMVFVLTALVGLMPRGCVSHLVATMIVKAPNLQQPYRPPQNPDRFYAQSWRVAVGPPAAELSVAVMEPGDYRFESHPKMTADAKGEHFGFNFRWKVRDARAAPAAPKATVVLLPGIMLSKETMIPWGACLAGMGYRVVLVDLRGHGRSSGEWIGFGAWEKEDLARVADELQRRGLLAGPLRALGISYGGAMALQWAAVDPRVESVVAVAPYSDPRKAIVSFARGYEPKLAAKISDATFARAEKQAARMAGFDWKDADVGAAVRRMRARVLFVHGARDTWVPPADTEALLALAPPGSSRIVLPHADHIVAGLRVEVISELADAFWERRPGATLRVPI
ncbi:MAG TPA: alpha/beta fold hydrolase [Opitutaceae bacterium]|nr:alpha/beta fold hydrolase [Opitutaceae bacterium]